MGEHRVKPEKILMGQILFGALNLFVQMPDRTNPEGIHHEKKEENKQTNIYASMIYYRI